MKKYLKNCLQILSFLVLAACSKSTESPPEIKLYPESFTLVFPLNNSVCQVGDLIADQPNKLGLTMKWHQSVNATSYELSMVNMVTDIEEVKLKVDDNIADVVLTKGTLYQWKINAINDNGEKESSQWSFYTKGESVGNHVPYPAYDFSFDVETSNHELAVGWKASDEDQDALLYDVRVFENDTEIMVLSGFEENSISDITITLDSTYYLIVTVKDGISETTTRSPTFTYN